MDWADVEMELSAGGREDLAEFVHDATCENKTVRMDTINAQIVDCLFRYIDRMDDVCDVDPADRILSEFVADVMPLISERIDNWCCKYSSQATKAVGRFRLQGGKCIRNISE